MSKIKRYNTIRSVGGERSISNGSIKNQIISKKVIEEESVSQITHKNKKSGYVATDTNPQTIEHDVRLNEDAAYIELREQRGVNVIPGHILQEKSFSDPTIAVGVDPYLGPNYSMDYINPGSSTDNTGINPMLKVEKIDKDTKRVISNEQSYSCANSLTLDATEIITRNYNALNFDTKSVNFPEESKVDSEKLAIDVSHQKQVRARATSRGVTPLKIKYFMRSTKGFTGKPSSKEHMKENSDADSTAAVRSEKTLDYTNKQEDIVMNLRTPSTSTELDACSHGFNQLGKPDSEIIFFESEGATDTQNTYPVEDPSLCDTLPRVKSQEKDNDVQFLEIEDTNMLFDENQNKTKVVDSHQPINDKTEGFKDIYADFAGNNKVKDEEEDMIGNELSKPSTEHKNSKEGAQYYPDHRESATMGNSAVERMKNELIPMKIDSAMSTSHVTAVDKIFPTDNEMPPIRDKPVLSVNTDEVGVFDAKSLSENIFLSNFEITPVNFELSVNSSIKNVKVSQENVANASRFEKVDSDDEHMLGEFRTNLPSMVPVTDTMHAEVRDSMNSEKENTDVDSTAGRITTRLTKVRSTDQNESIAGNSLEVDVTTSEASLKNKTGTAYNQTMQNNNIVGVSSGTVYLDDNLTETHLKVLEDSPLSGHHSLQEKQTQPASIDTTTVHKNERETEREAETEDSDVKESTISAPDVNGEENVSKDINTENVSVSFDDQSEVRVDAEPANNKNSSIKSVPESSPTKSTKHRVEDVLQTSESHTSQPVGNDNIFINPSDSENENLYLEQLHNKTKSETRPKKPLAPPDIKPAKNKKRGFFNLNFNLLYGENSDGGTDETNSNLKTKEAGVLDSSASPHYQSFKEARKTNTHAHADIKKYRKEVISLRNEVMALKEKLNASKKSEEKAHTDLELVKVETDGLKKQVKELTTAKIGIENELEDLTQSLFSEANKMVAEEKKNSYELEQVNISLLQKVKTLEAYISEAQTLKNSLPQISTTSKTTKTDVLVKVNNSYDYTHSLSLDFVEFLNTQIPKLKLIRDTNKIKNSISSKKRFKKSKLRFNINAKNVLTSKMFENGKFLFSKYYKQLLFARRGNAELWSKTRFINNLLVKNENLSKHGALIARTMIDLVVDGRFRLVSTKGMEYQPKCTFHEEEKAEASLDFYLHDDVRYKVLPQPLFLGESALLKFSNLASLLNFIKLCILLLRRKIVSKKKYKRNDSFFTKYGYVMYYFQRILRFNAFLNKNRASSNKKLAYSASDTLLAS